MTTMAEMPEVCQGLTAAGDTGPYQAMLALPGICHKQGVGLTR